MGLLQKACETYDAHAHYAGVERAEHQTLAPVSHILTNAQIEITLRPDGTFLAARAVDKSEPKIIIPVTEDSGGRTSSPCAHPLCDQLCYLAPYNEQKFTMYVTQLEQWTQSAHSHPKLLPILTYVKGGTILADLAREAVIKLNEKGQPEQEKLLVRWRVTGLGKNDACWKDKSLFDAFIAWYSSQQEESSQTLCMITGTLSTPAKQHPKGIIPINGNAKLISANDSQNFTYRGRFTDAAQSATVSYLASQKAHNALRWIAAEQGVQAVFGGRTFLCWNPQGKKVASITSPMMRRRAQPLTEPTSYKKALREALMSFRNELPADKDGVVIAAFDAATTGRLSLTYYNELAGSDFLQRLYDWDKSCCWPNWPHGIESPPLWKIVDCAFGTQREENGRAVLKTDDRVMKQQLQRLITCRVDRMRMPTDIEQALVHRASNPQAYDRSCWQKILSTACAVIQKYYYDRKKEDETMSWELDKKDRNFQYGRLLAVMEQAEADYYYRTQENRETNAIKLMSVFCQRPFYVYELVNRQLQQAYLPRIASWQKERYHRLTNEIISIIKMFPEEDLNKPLKETYLLGYHCQQMEFYKSTKNASTEENENEYTEE